MNSKLKYVMLIVLLFSVLLLSGCTKEKDRSETDIDTSNSHILVSELEAQGISLYADSETSNNEMYADLIVKTADYEKKTSWKTLRLEGFVPALQLIDFSGLENPQLYIKLTTGKGTGVLMEEVHILDVVSLKEYPVEAISEIIEKCVINRSDAEQYKLIINGKEEMISKKLLSVPMDQLFQQPVFENIVTYSGENNVLTAEIPMQLSPTLFYGELVITYFFEDTGFVAGKVEYKSGVEE